MNTTGKRARRESGLNRHQLKRAVRAKRHEALNNATHNQKIGTNARLAAKRESEKKS